MSKMPKTLLSRFKARKGKPTGAAKRSPKRTSTGRFKKR